MSPPLRGGRLARLDAEVAWAEHVLDFAGHQQRLRRERGASVSGPAPDAATQPLPSLRRRAERRALNLGGRSALRCGMCRSPMARTSGIERVGTRAAPRRGPRRLLAAPAPARGDTGSKTRLCWHGGGTGASVRCVPFAFRMSVARQRRYSSRRSARALRAGVAAVAVDPGACAAPASPQTTAPGLSPACRQRRAAGRRARRRTAPQRHAAGRHAAPAARARQRQRLPALQMCRPRGATTCSTDAAPAAAASEPWRPEHCPFARAASRLARWPPGS